MLNKIIMTVMLLLLSIASTNAAIKQSKGDFED